MRKLLQSKFFHITLGLSVSAVLIVWLAHEVEGRKVLAHLKSINYLMFVPALVLFVGQLWLRALRWRYLLPGDERIPLRTLFDAIMLGNFGSFVLPLRAGEFVRPFVLSRQSKRSFPTAFASVVIERFFDLSVVLIFFAVMTALLGRMPAVGSSGPSAADLAEIRSLLRGVALMFSLLAAFILLFMAIGSYFPKLIVRVADFFLRPFGETMAAPVRHLIRDFLSGTEVLRRPRNLILVIALSLVVWVTTVIGYYVFFWLFPDMQASLWLAFLTTVILALGVAAPSAPGFIGVYHASCVAAFALAGVDKEKAAAYALVTHAMQYLYVIAYGVFLLAKYGLHFGELWRAREKAV